MEVWLVASSAAFRATSCSSWEVALPSCPVNSSVRHDSNICLLQFNILPASLSLKVNKPPTQFRPHKRTYNDPLLRTAPIKTPNRLPLPIQFCHTPHLHTNIISSLSTYTQLPPPLYHNDMIPLPRLDLPQLRVPRRTRLKLIRHLFKVQQQRTARFPPQRATYLMSAMSEISRGERWTMDDEDAPHSSPNIAA